MNELSPSTITIKVVVRHGTKCKREHPGLPQDYKDCNCRKSIYIYENGKDRPISAKTRSWEQAERVAQAERDKRDPDKLKVKELEERLASIQAEAKAAAAKKTLTIEDGTDRWLKAQKGVVDTTAARQRWVVSRIRAWAEDNKIETVAEVTADHLSKWREEWSPVAEKSFRRLEPSTQGAFRSSVKGIFEYWVSLGDYLDRSPADGLKPIRIKGKKVLPLSPCQFDDLLAAIPTCCVADNGNLRGFTAEFKALCLFQRWSGLRIGDAVALPRSGLEGNRFTLTTQKTGVLIKNRVIPDLVAAEMTALTEERPGFRKGYFFWPESISNLRSLECTWERYFGKLNSFLNFTNELNEPMWFHSHMLRHTFAVQHLLQGMPIEEVSKLLTHESIATTEKYYSYWVKDRLDKMERDYISCMRKLGMIVTSPADLEPAKGVQNVLNTFMTGLAKTGLVSPLQLEGVAEVVNGLLGIGNHAGRLPLVINTSGGAQISNRARLAS